MQNEMYKDQQSSLIKVLIKLALPAVGSTLFFVVFEVVDLFWIGRLGGRAVAALGASSFFVWMLRALAQTVATGALARVSRRVGESDTRGVMLTAGNALLSAILFSLVTLGIMFSLSRQIFLWIGLEPGISSQATGYAQVILVGLVFIYLSVTAEHVIRGTGNTRTPMLITGFSLLLNAALDPIFIYTLDFGLKGAAYATVLSQIVGCILMLVALAKRLPGIVRMHFHLNYRFLKDHFYPTVKIGVPISVSGAMFAIIYLILSGIISHFGSDALAAIGIGHRIEAFPYFVALGFSMATATLVGQNLGAGKPRRAQHSVYWALGLVSGVLFLVSLVFAFAPEPLYRIFVDDGRIIEIGAGYLRIIALFETFLALEVVLEGAFSGAGDTRPPMLVLFPITFLRVPAAWFFGIVLNLGVGAIWFAISFTTFLKGVLLFWWFQKGHWMNKQV